MQSALIKKWTWLNLPKPFVDSTTNSDFVRSDLVEMDRMRLRMETAMRAVCVNVYDMVCAQTKRNEKKEKYQFQVQ